MIFNVVTRFCQSLTHVESMLGLCYKFGVVSCMFPPQCHLHGIAEVDRNVFILNHVLLFFLQQLPSSCGRKRPASASRRG